jgi:plastocyanin
MNVPRHIRVALVVVASASCVQACSGGGGGANTSANTASSTTPPADTTAGAATSAAGGGGAASGAGAVAVQPPTGKTVKVQMLGDDKGYRESPLNVTVKAGDAVQWVNTSGGPHNVSFWPDSIPAGTAQQLAANMPAQTGAGPAQKLGDLVGPLLTAASDTYTISFAGLKPGVYRYYCTPHIALAMKGMVTVQ